MNSVIIVISSTSYQRQLLGVWRETGHWCRLSHEWPVHQSCRASYEVPKKISCRILVSKSLIIVIMMSTEERSYKSDLQIRERDWVQYGLSNLVLMLSNVSLAHQSRIYSLHFNWPATAKSEGSGNITGLNSKLDVVFVVPSKGPLADHLK